MTEAQQHQAYLQDIEAHAEYEHEEMVHYGNVGAEKAKELVGKFKKYSNGVHLRSDDRFIYKPEIVTKNAKQCALIAVDEILKENEANFSHDAYNYDMSKNYEYWQEVKKEINLL